MLIFIMKTNIYILTSIAPSLLIFFLKIAIYQNEKT